MVEVVDWLTGQMKQKADEKSNPLEDNYSRKKLKQFVKNKVYNQK